MEVEQIKQLKRDLEYHILLQITNFEAKTGQKVSGIGVIMVNSIGHALPPKTTAIVLNIQL